MGAFALAQREAVADLISKFTGEPMNGQRLMFVRYRACVINKATMNVGRNQG